MNSAANAFLQACDREGLKYVPPKITPDGKTVLRLNVRGTHGNGYAVTYVFPPEEKDVSIRIFGLVTARKEILAKVIYRCNKMNNRFRWVKFLVDDDMDLNLEADCVITPETAGEVCMEMFYHFVRAADEAYPGIVSNYGALNPDLPDGGLVSEF